MKKSSTKQGELSLIAEPTQGAPTDSEALAAQVLSDFLADESGGGPDAAAGSSPAQADLFVVMETVHDWPIKDDVSTMEFPIFSLSKKPDTQIRTYSRAGKTVRYALVVSVETAEQTSTTIHDEVRAKLRQQVRDRARGRVQS